VPPGHTGNGVCRRDRKHPITERIFGAFDWTGLVIEELKSYFIKLTSQILLDFLAQDDARRRMSKLGNDIKSDATIGY
jgi:hypothetical protein